jgi:replicative DNA helicase
MRHGIGLILHDYIQIFANPKGHSLYEAVTQGALAVQSVKQTLKIPIIAACQLNQVDARDPNKKPGMPDLRDSGYIGQAADVATFIWHDPASAEKGEYPAKAELLVRKCRGGQTGSIPAWWWPRLTQFGERVPDDAQAERYAPPSYSGKMKVVKTSGEME